MPIPPSTPPERPPSKRPGAPEPPGTALRAVLTGVGIDICATKLVSVVVVLFYAWHLSTPDMTVEQVDEALRNAPPQIWFMLLMGALGSFVSVAAGYVCARIARRGEFRVGAIMAAASVFVSLALGDGDGAPIDLALLYVLCDIACTLLGVKYGAEHNRRLEAPASAPADASAP